MAISHYYWHVVVRNGNFSWLLMSCGQEWQFNIATDMSWSRMAISHCYWHLVAKNGNFTLLLTSSGQEWQFHIATDISWSKMVNAVNTTTLNLADIEDILAQSIEHRCLDYWYTKSVSHIGQCRYKPKSDGSHQLSIDALTTSTPNKFDMH